MNRLFNINIDSNKFGFKYGCEAIDLETPHIVESGINYTGGFSDENGYVPVQFKTENDLSYDGVYEIMDEEEDFQNTIITDSSETLLTIEKLLNIKIYFPDFSIEKYENYPLYVFKASTFINGCEVILCRRLISRLDATAVTYNRQLFNQQYYEEFSFNIINPYNICYDDAWAYFRQTVCKWINDSNLPFTNSDYNDEGCILYVELIPVVENNDGISYSENEKYSGGSNSIFLSDRSNYLHNVISIENGKLVNTIKFNSTYDTLSDYILDTYGNYGYTNCYFNIVNEQGDYIPDIRVIPLIDDPDDPDNNTATLDIIEDFDPSLTWDDYREGFFVTCRSSIYDDNDNLILSIFSDEYKLTPEDWGRLIANSNDLNLGNISDLANMNIDVVNKIVNNVIEVQRPDNDQSHLILPVFIKVKDAQNLEIYTNVTENVTINLDAYKSSVSSFILQIENVEFNEVARSPYGITFKVTGASLPKVENEGTYYILNEERVLVTTGKYKYKQ